MDEQKDEKTQKARRAVGEVNGEWCLFDTWEPEREDLPAVHFAYVPLVPNKLQALVEKMQTAGRKEAIRLSVNIVAAQVRQWTARDLSGAAVDPRNAVEISGKLDNFIIEAVCNRILDGRSTQTAQQALSDFLKP